MPYSRIKIDFDVTCLMVTALLTFFGLGRIEGLGIGTVAAAFTMGKGIVLMGKLLGKKVCVCLRFITGKTVKCRADI